MQANENISYLSFDCSSCSYSLQLTQISIEKYIFTKSKNKTKHLDSTGLFQSCAYQILKLDENDPSEGHQDFFVVTSAFTKRVCQQQNHQDRAKKSSGKTL